MRRGRCTRFDAVLGRRPLPPQSGYSGQLSTHRARLCGRSTRGDMHMMGSVHDFEDGACPVRATARARTRSDRRLLRGTVHMIMSAARPIFQLKRNHCHIRTLW